MTDLVVRDIGRRSYAPTLALQEELVARKLDGDPADYLLLVEHDPVYTLGRGADAGDLCGADRQLGVPVHRVGRGGGVTFHGPGQLVAYPIVSLRRGGRDVHHYVRQLEAVLLGVCAAFGVTARRREGQQDDRGLRVARTIADLAGAEVVDSDHVDEAVAYRPPPVWSNT